MKDSAQGKEDSMLCKSCQYNNAAEALICNLCGTLLKRARKEPRSDKRRKEEDRKKASETWLDLHTDVDEITPEEEREKEVITRAIKRAYGLRMQQKNKNYCLTCFPFDPIPLVPGSSVVIGRTSAADLTLPLGLVSREHARIVATGRTYELHDLKSSNGTRVNGKKLMHKVLEPGDVIQIGPYEIQFRSYTGSIADLIASEDDTERTQTLTSQDDGTDTTSFAGKVGEMRMDEVIQLIEFNRKTGTLLASSDRKSGFLHFLDGQILHAEFADAEDTQAVIQVISMESGNFSFQVGVPDCKRTIFEPTSKILLDALRLMDEDR
jgi:hypothetical protein